MRVWLAPTLISALIAVLGGFGIWSLSKLLPTAIAAYDGLKG